MRFFYFITYFLPTAFMAQRDTIITCESNLLKKNNNFSYCNQLFLKPTLVRTDKLFVLVNKKSHNYYNYDYNYHYYTVRLVVDRLCF